MAEETTGHQPSRGTGRAHEGEWSEEYVRSSGPATPRGQRHRANAVQLSEGKWMLAAFVAVAAATGIGFLAGWLA